MFEYSARKRVALEEMLKEFAAREGYILKFRFYPESALSDFIFITDFGIRHESMHVEVEWLKARDLFTVYLDITKEVDRWAKEVESKPQQNPYIKIGDYKIEQRPNGSMAFFYDKTPAAKLRIKKVIFNNPATIVMWFDGTKTVAKATDEEFDPEKGLAMAISKKALGNSRDYYHTFLHWLKKYEKQEVTHEQFELKTGAVINFDGADLQKKIYESLTNSYAKDQAEKAHTALVKVLRDTRARKSDLYEAIEDAARELGKALGD